MKKLSKNRAIKIKKQGAPVGNTNAINKYERNNVMKIINEYLDECYQDESKMPRIEELAIRRLGISKSTLYEWKKVHRVVSDAIKKVKTMQEEWLISNGIKARNPIMYIFLLKCNHGYVETQHIKQDQRREVKIELVNYSDVSKVVDAEYEERATPTPTPLEKAKTD